MKILILGGSGMLGHRLWINLRKEHDVWVTVRGNPNKMPNVPEFSREHIRPNVDALVFDQVTRALASIQPDLVINCIGLIKQHGHVAKDPLFSISLNALLPHRISLICRTAGIRMIHISTDCVFSGKEGNYTEGSFSDAEDIYGRTKYLGEVHYPHCVTLRTSIIGQELATKMGLVEWFLSQEGRVNGYRNAIFTGFTTDELSHLIMDYVIPNTGISGLYHVSSDPISKYDLLKLVKKAYKKDIEIDPYDDFYCDRSLLSARFREATGYQPPAWEDMITEMAKSEGFYKKIHNLESNK
jgi:dTDP-4-dehydrorhamnose reductase